MTNKLLTKKELERVKARVEILDLDYERASTQIIYTLLDHVDALEAQQATPCICQFPVGCFVQVLHNIQTDTDSGLVIKKGTVGEVVKYGPDMDMVLINFPEKMVAVFVDDLERVIESHANVPDPDPLVDILDV